MLQAGFPVPLRYIYEGRPGKPWALNAGLREAKGRIFAFTDDDVLVAPTWLRGLWTCLREEGIDAVTGKILPLWITARPAWVTDNYLKFGGTGCLDYGDRRLHRTDRSNLRWVGGNLAIRREAVERVGGYDVRMIRAQDTEYYHRCIRNGITVCYEPEAVVYHKLGGDRLTPDYFRRWRHRTGHYHAYLLPWRKHHLLTVVPITWYAETWSSLRSWVAKRLTRRPWEERFRDELRLREASSVWLHRLQLWPRWALTVLTGRWSPMDDATMSSVHSVRATSRARPIDKSISRVEGSWPADGQLPNRNL